ncbi:hypothetical protein ACOMHN_043481 [Nucella lapillus]
MFWKLTERSKRAHVGVSGVTYVAATLSQRLPPSDNLSRGITILTISFSLAGSWRYERWRSAVLTVTLTKIDQQASCELCKPCWSLSRV